MSISTTVDNNLTIGDLLAESQMFEMSKEYFSIIKEASEIELLERFCDCQEFITENAGIPSELKSMLITEAGSDMVPAGSSEMTSAGKSDMTSSESNPVVQKLEKKKSGFFSRIAAGFMKILNALVSLWGRFIKFWTSGKEIARLRGEAKMIQRAADYDLAEAADKLEAAFNTIKSKDGEISRKDEALNRKDRDIARKEGELKSKDRELKRKDEELKRKDWDIKSKHNEIGKLKVISCQKDAEISRVNAFFKGVNPGLYREIQQIERMISEEVLVEIPATVSEIDDFTKEAAAAIESFKVIRTKVGGNGNLHHKHAKKISDILTRVRESRNKMNRVTITQIYLDDSYKSLQKSRDSLAESIAEINKSFNVAQDYPNNMSTTKKSDVLGMRLSADANFMEIQRNLGGLLNEMMYLVNTSITTIKEIMDTRSHNLKMQATVLDEIRRAGTAA